nr:hypothetical protein [Saprospiraceae bacterium]
MKQTFLQFIFISLLSLPLSVTVLSAQCDVGTVSGKLWTETNINMIQDQNEPSLRNITLRLYPDYNNNTFIDSNEPLLDAVTTDTIGKYSFTNVSPGTYLIDLDGINTDLHAMSRINPGSANYSFVLENNDCINDLNIAFAESGCNNSVSNLCTFFASIGDRIYSINSQTGATFLLTDISEDAPEGFPLPTAVNAMGSDPVTGWVYYISSGQSENNYRLYGWNIYTNTHKVISNDLTEYGIVPFGTNIGSAAYFYNGSLYIGVGTFPSRVWRIDFNSSSNGETIRSASLITTTSSWRWRDLVIIDGTMYMSYYKGGVRLERFDLIGGGALVDMTTDPLSNVQQLATCGNGELLSVGDSIQVINTTSGNFSGTATPILGFSGSSFDAAGCIPAHASIGDLVWIDSNANNTYDDGEQPIPYVIVSLYEDTNGDNLFDSRDRFLGTRTTDINGNYLFENLPLGRYWVVLSPTNNPFISNGAVATTPSGNQQYHQLGVTEHRTIADFGFNAATLPVELIYFRGVKYGECSI